ncbi:poly(3-hydroxybutyrate) depolymerase-like [Ptychodera flava]|uniref:poly(3-hydroxybutyrate) depolymerase-like n=1 Tax=Ptychodera flava TaxID=63121 RepID=UPI00396A57D3
MKSIVLYLQLIQLVVGCPWWWCPDPNPPQKLPSYGADPTQVSVSGVSSGGYMAIQMHVAYSSSVMGSGIFAAGPYHCAEGSTMKALGACMSRPQEISVQDLIDFTDNAAQTGDIDPVSDFAKGKTWLFSGTQDSTVDQGVMVALEEYCAHYMPAASILTDFTTPAGHATITDHYGNGCSAGRRPWINNCDIPCAYILLNHIYGGTLSKPPVYGGELPGQMITFDQTELEPSPYLGITSLDEMGYVYVPSGCIDTPGCKVHISVHGCLQGRHNLDEEYVINSGYNEVAEANNIIMIWPQAEPALGNTNGCWDWWGYTDSSYDIKSGVQMRFMKNIIDRVTSPI